MGEISVQWLQFYVCLSLIKDFLNTSVATHLSLCGVLLLGLARRDVEWGSWWSQGLGKQVHPHHQTSLVDGIKAGRKEA